MAQRDYVGYGRSTGTSRKKTVGRSNHKKSKGDSGNSKIIVLAAILVTFAGGLWCISLHKKEEVPEILNHKTNSSALPPKPEERWKYIRELENRPTITMVPSQIEPSVGGDIKSQIQLTDEQLLLLAQIKTDMSQQPTQLKEVPWNEQTQMQHQQTLQHQPMQEPIIHKSSQQESVKHTKPQEMLNKVKSNEKITFQHYWTVQCGSFKGINKAESVRARLAFKGFEGRITTGGGWNRVVIGPFKNLSSADSAVKRLHSSGHRNAFLSQSGVETP